GECCRAEGGRDPATTCARRWSRGDVPYNTTLPDVRGAERVGGPRPPPAPQLLAPAPRRLIQPTISGSRGRAGASEGPTWRRIRSMSQWSGRVRAATSPRFAVLSSG